MAHDTTVQGSQAMQVFGIALDETHLIELGIAVIFGIIIAFLAWNYQPR